MDKEQEKLVIGANGLDINEDELNELQQVMHDFVEPKTKEFLLKNFDYANYKTALVDKLEFPMVVFWALARDRYLDMRDGMLYVEWKTYKKKYYAPKLMNFKKKKDHYKFIVRYFRGVGEHSKKHIYTTSTIKVSFQEYDNFLKDYSNEIKELEQRTRQVQC